MLKQVSDIFDACSYVLTLLHCVSSMCRCLMLGPSLVKVMRWAETLTPGYHHSLFWLHMSMFLVSRGIITLLKHRQHK